MQHRILHNLTFLCLAVACLLPCPGARAEADASSQISFGSLAITPSSGAFELTPGAQASAFVQAGVTNQYNSGNPVSANAAGDFSLANGTASFIVTPVFNVAGSASSSASVPGGIVASDEGTARGAITGDFMITGGSGSVNALFSLQISGSLSVFTDFYGQSAYAETVMTLELNGNPTLFDDRYYDIGQSDSSGQTFSTTLSQSVTLQYDTPYEFDIEGDAETSVSNVPEPGVGILVAAGLLLAGLGRIRRTLKIGRITRYLVAGAISLWFAGAAGAMYMGSDAPDICQTCGVQSTRESGGTVQTSLTEGNVREDYPVFTLPGGGAPAMQFTLTYNSYNADGSKSQTDSGVGLGWSHSYDIFLFRQRSQMFRMGADGRITQYRFVSGSNYITDPGYFETLTAQWDGSYTITNKEQSWWRFASVPYTPFLVAGPVYRLVQMGDRNQNITTLTYNNGLLKTITDTYGRTIKLGYTNNSKLACVTDPLGRVTRFKYDPRWRSPVMITDPAGKTVQYTYNSLYQITRKVDRDGRMYFYLYKNQLPFAVVDGGGQGYFSLANPTKWGINQSYLALMLRRTYLPSTATKTDGDGNLWQYHYDTNGYVTQVTDPDGSTTSYVYDPVAYRPAIVTNADGAVTRYQYDAMGNRTATTDALGNTTTYTYDPVFNQITSLTDPNGRVTTYQYDSRGNEIQETDALGQSSSWTYDSHGNMLSATDKLGNTTSYQYDGSGNRIEVTDPLGNITHYQYDADGNRTNTTDALGRTTTYQYDSLNRRIGETNALDGVTTYTYDAVGRTIQVTDPNTDTTSYLYDVRGRLSHTTDALGHTTTYQYDADNNRTSTTDALGRVTMYQYDSLNRQIGQTDALGGVTTSTYDPVGNQTSLTDPDGHTTTYTYDALNRRISQTDPLGGLTMYDYADTAGPPCCGATAGSSLITEKIDPLGNITFYHYDELNRLVNTVRKQSDTNDVINPTDAVTSFTYDADSNRVLVTDPVGNATSYAYDALNRVVTTVNAAGDTTAFTYDAVGNTATTTAPNGNLTTYTYDALNRRISTSDSIGAVSTTTYDADGNRLAVTDGNGNTTTYQYDALNRRISETDPLGHATTTMYDAVGNGTGMTDRLGNVTTYTYDALNRRVGLTDALGDVTATTYDAVGNVNSLTDANGHVTSYTYDALNRRTTETYPDTSPNTIIYTYDAVGNRISRVDQKGQVTTYTYSPLYYLTNRAYLPSGSMDMFTYDLAGRMLTAERGGWVDTFTYDGADRPLATVQNGQSVTYIYNIPGRVQTNTYPSGRAIIYTYDARNRLLTLQDGTPNPPIVTYTYDGADRVVTRAYRNNTLATYAYNPDNWVTSLIHSLGAIHFVAFTYAYDNEGNKLYESKQHDLTDSEAYSYDALYRLTDYRTGTLSGSVIPSPVIEKTWTLDPLGNWTSIVSNAVTETRTYGPANELITINTSNLVYDANGNLQEDLAYIYTYDEENRLTQVERLSDSAIVGQYVYDALGRRVIHYVNPSGIPSDTFYYYDSNRLIEEQNVGGMTLATYTYGNYVDEALTMDCGGQTYYYHQNSLWSAHALTDGSGNVVERYAYDAYGLVTVYDASFNPLPLNSWGTPHSAVGNYFLYTGRQLDEETGLYYYRARYYDALKGRFLQRDPAGYPEGMDLYEYVSDRPTRSVDPSGLGECDAYKSCITANPVAAALYTVCSTAGHSSWAVCVRECLQSVFDTNKCRYRERSALLGALGGPESHLRCFSYCTAKEVKDAAKEAAARAADSFFRRFLPCY